MKEQVKAIMARVFELPAIDDHISSSNCDQWDSLRHLNLTIELEMEFGVEFEPEEIAGMNSLDAILNTLIRKQS